MSMIIEGLSLFGCFTLDLVIQVNKLFLDIDVTKLSGRWGRTKIEINKIN